MYIYMHLPRDIWLVSVEDRWHFRTHIGGASLLNSSVSFDWLLLLLLLDAVVFVLIDDILVPDENDEPSELAEFGRRPVDSNGIVSCIVTTDIECLNFGAVFF